MRLILFIALFPTIAFAQLNQLGFDSAKPEVEKKPVNEDALKEITGGSDPIPKNAAEAEAAEKAALEKLKSKNSVSTSSVASSSAATSSVATSNDANKKFDYFGGVIAIGTQHGCSSIPPRLKGPYVDENNEASITSKVAWPLPKNKDCSSIVEEKSFLNKALALREVLYRFSGYTDYTDLAVTNICASHCNNTALVTDIKIDNNSLLVGMVDGACRYILEKPKDKPWKMLRAQSVVCSCFDQEKVKTALDSQKLESK